MSFTSICIIFIFQTFFRPKVIYNTHHGGIDAIMRGLCESKAQTMDRFLTKAVTKHLFTDRPPHGLGTDLSSLNIQRGRDHGIPGLLFFYPYIFPA